MTSLFFLFFLNLHVTIEDECDAFLSLFPLELVQLIKLLQANHSP